MLTWKEHALFFSTFFRKPLQLGGLVPTSRAAARRLSDQIDWTGVRTVVELGAGVGPITEVVHERKPAGVRFLVFEREESFRRLLQERCPGISVHQEAAELSDILQSHGVDHAEVIITSIPLSVLSAAEQAHLLRLISSCLAPGGLCLILQIRSVMGRHLVDHFDRVSQTRLLWNFPPAVLYRCEKAPH